MDATAILLSALGLLGAGGVVTLVKIAVASESKRADTWREIAQTSAAAAERNEGHVRELVGAVQQLTAAQRESLAILQSMQAERLGRTRDALLITPTLATTPPPELAGGVA